MSFTQGLSGLNAASKDLEVIGNNVANVNTVGFKGSQAQFADVFAAALSGSGAAQIGIGTRLATVAQQFTQGTISITNNTLDMAINGAGFFVMNSLHGITYTRNGQFQLDKNGSIVSSTGAFLQGFPATAAGVVQVGSTGPLTVPTGTGNPAPSTAITAGVNLDASAAIPITGTFDPAVSTSYNNATSVTTYDAQGSAQSTTMYFKKSPSAISLPLATTASTTNTLTTATVASTAGLVIGELITGGNFPAGTTIASITNGTTFVASAAAGATSAAIAITFGPTATTAVAGNVGTVTSTVGLAAGQSITGGGFPAGTMITSITNGTTFVASQAATGAAGAVTFGATAGNVWEVYTQVKDATTQAVLDAGQLTEILTFNPNGTLLNTTQVAPIAYASANDPLNPTAQTLALDLTAVTQFAGPFGVTTLNQDGYALGNLSGFSIGTDGKITGRYSNGVTKVVGQVALSTFANMQGLQPLGDNQWAQTGASGSPVPNSPGTGNAGVLQTSAVEGSNVDLTAELVNMVTAQRNYQANSQTIKVQDAVFQTLLNLR